MQVSFRDPDVIAVRAAAKRRIAELLMGVRELPAPLSLAGRAIDGLHVIGVQPDGASAVLEIGTPQLLATLRARPLTQGGVVTSLRKRRPGQVVAIDVEPRGVHARPHIEALSSVARHIESEVGPDALQKVTELLTELRQMPSDRELDVYRFAVAGIGGHMAMIRTGLRCNQDCTFCWQSREWTDFPPAQILTWIDDFRAAGFVDLVISGGEPTLDRSLPDYIRHAKSIGFEQVGIESNAIQMAKPGFAERLREAGLDCALVSLHSPDAAVSDAETRAPGTHVRTVAGIRRLLDVGSQVILNVLMTPRTLPTLKDWPAFAAQHFGGTTLLRQIIFSIPCKPFDASHAVDVVPDPYEVAAVLPGVVQEALRLGLPVNGLEMPCGPPMCAFGADARVATLAPLPAPIDFRTHVPACEKCAARPFCFGPRNEQIELFGDEWVTPIVSLPGDVARTHVPQRPAHRPPGPLRIARPDTHRVTIPDGPAALTSGGSDTGKSTIDDEVAAENVAVAREVLAPLFEPVAQRALTVTRLAADPRMPAVTFELSSGGSSVEVRLGPRDEREKTYLRTPSFDVSYRSDLGDTQHRPLTPALRTALALLKRALELTDRGGHRFACPQLPASAPPVAPTKSEEPRKDVLDHRWDRAAFDAAVGPAFAAARDKDWVVVMVKQGCEQHCVFCPLPDRDKTNPRWGEIRPDDQLEDILHQLRRARAFGARYVAIGANEPLSFPHLWEVLTEATALGYERINLQSTALPLSERAMAERLSAFERVEMLIPIYGATAAEHEAITQTPGSFDRLCTALGHIVELGAPRFRLQTLALASTFHRIDAIADFVKERFGTTLYVAPLRANRVGEREHLGDAARLSDVRALAIRRPELKMTEFPLCVLGPAQRERRAVDGLATSTVNLWAIGLEKPEDPTIVSDRGYGFAEACDGCAVKSECPGFLRPYLERHGGAEASPLE